MHQLRKLLLAGMAAGLMASPAPAWEFGISDGGDIFWTVAEDFSGEASLAFYCRLSEPGAIHAQILIGQRGPDSAVAVELGFDVADRSFGPIAAVAESAEDALSVATRSDGGTVGEAARAIYAEGGMVLLTYYENSWRFDGGDYADDFGAMLNACG